MLSPICLFTYNRPNETRQTVEALRSNHLAPSSELYIFSDGPKNDAAKEKVNEVRNYLQSITGFKTIRIIESPINKGLANSIIDGVTEIIGKYGKVIVLEDDLISSPNFLDFMNQALEHYNHDKNLQSINGYSLSIKSNTDDIYFQVRPFPWGWGTWSDRWNKDIFDKQNLRNTIDSDHSLLKKFRKKCGADISKMLLNSLSNRNDSWYVRWTFDHFRKNSYSVFPAHSFIQNIGHTNEGTHCKGINSYRSTSVDQHKDHYSFIDFQLPHKKLTKEFLRYFTLRHKLKIRIELLPSKAGRRKLIEDFKIKTGII